MTAAVRCMLGLTVPLRTGWRRTLSHLHVVRVVIRQPAGRFSVQGKGWAESFCSSAHGAGRCMSRLVAVKQCTVADVVQQTQGVIDEIPGAYKDIDAVMGNQSDLTENLHTPKLVVCLKG